MITALAPCPGCGKPGFDAPDGFGMIAEAALGGAAFAVGGLPGMAMAAAARAGGGASSPAATHEARLLGGGGGMVGLAKSFYREVVEGSDEAGHPVLRCRQCTRYVVACRKCEAWMSLPRRPKLGELVECRACNWRFTTPEMNDVWRRLLASRDNVPDRSGLPPLSLADGPCAVVLTSSRITKQGNIEAMLKATLSGRYPESCAHAAERLAEGEKVELLRLSQAGASALCARLALKGIAAHAEVPSA